MMQFDFYLKKYGEVGYVIRSLQSLAYIDGLPSAMLSELVVFNDGNFGRIISLAESEVEVLLLTTQSIKVGTKVARVGAKLEVGVGEELLGRVMDPLVRDFLSRDLIKTKQTRSIDITPGGISSRVKITETFETGVSWVDLIIPLGRGQRELVIGDRKIGKTDFLLQVMLAASKRNDLCIYGAIAKNKQDIKEAEEFIRDNKIEKNTIMVVTSASDPAGMIFLAPFTAMTIAEYFRDQGRGVLLILDDMTAHAKYYREIMLLARRFPGRSSYPGDIFYVQSRLLERAGNFSSGSITVLPVAELIMSDMSGYIQTNLMSITDGHILFDTDYYNQGRRPAINPFLSVSRVGHQTQSMLMRDVGREVTSFLVKLTEVRQYMHFGAELSELTKNILTLGEQVMLFFEQTPQSSIPSTINVVMLAGIWAGLWKNKKPSDLKAFWGSLVTLYETDKNFSQWVKELVSGKNKFIELVEAVKQNSEKLKME